MGRSTTCNKWFTTVVRRAQRREGLPICKLFSSQQNPVLGARMNDTHFSMEFSSVKFLCGRPNARCEKATAPANQN